MKKFFSNQKLWAIVMMFIFAMAIISRASRFFDGTITDEKRFFNIVWIVLFSIGFISNLLKYIKLTKQSTSTEQIINDETEQVR
jgi:hypothetical protein